MYHYIFLFVFFANMFSWTCYNNKMIIQLFKISTKYLIVLSAFNFLKVLLLLYILAYYAYFMFIN